MRHINRAIILNLIRVHQPVSRAGLSAHTGIFRSNVSGIVDELIASGLVREELATPSGRGRVPKMLYLREDGFQVLGISIRPTHTSVASAGLTGKPREPITFATPEDPAGMVELLTKAFAELRAREGGPHGFRQIGVSIPGLVDSASGQVLWIPTLPAYAGFPLRKELEERLGVPVEADNDCNLGALADLWLRESEVASIGHAVFLEIGDVGVGAGLVVNRELYRGHDSRFVGEFGHMIVEPAGTECRCGRHGCWELYVCDRATWQRYRPGVPFTGDSTSEMFAAARQGEETALTALRETARYLTLGVSNIVLALNPELIVVAGRLTEVWDLIAPMIRTHFVPSQIELPLKPAQLAPEPLFVQGAVSLALRQSFAQPRLGW